MRSVLQASKKRLAAPRSVARLTDADAGDQPAATALVAGVRHPELRGRGVSLQRAAGNRAIAGLLRPVTVQRHSSWEHALLGDTPPKLLGSAAVTNESRKHVLAGEWERMKFFQNNPYADPTRRFPDVRWIKLG